MEKIKYEYAGLQLFSLICIGAAFGFVSTSLYYDYQMKFNKGFTIQDTCLVCSQVYGEKDYKTVNLTNFLDIVNKNCGSTFFTTWKGNYTLFYQDCNSDGYCKSDYKSLDCIWGFP